MLEWMQGLGGPQFAAALLWTAAVLILLVLVLLAIKLIRNLTFGTFVAGGRNRKTRLAVMDATAVDSHRRLVLIRRDDTEHLLLIGGPTDVVVERDIRLVQQRRPALTGHASPDALPHPKPRLADPAPAGPRQPDPAPARRPASPVAAPARPSAPPPAAPPARRPSPPQTMRSSENPHPSPNPRPAGDVVLPTAPQHRPPPAEIPPAPLAIIPPAPLAIIPPAPLAIIPPAPLAIIPPAPSAAPPYASNGAGTTSMKHSTPPPARQNSSSLDETLLRELEVTFDSSKSRMPIKPLELTLDEEMTKLLGELSSHKRS